MAEERELIIEAVDSSVVTLVELQRFTAQVEESGQEHDQSKLNLYAEW